MKRTASAVPALVAFRRCLPLLEVVGLVECTPVRRGSGGRGGGGGGSGNGNTMCSDMHVERGLSDGALKTDAPWPRSPDSASIGRGWAAHPEGAYV